MTYKASEEVLECMYTFFLPTWNADQYLGKTMLIIFIIEKPDKF